MKNDLDLVLRDQVPVKCSAISCLIQAIFPNFGEDGKKFVRSLRATLKHAETVRKEYMGHQTHMRLSQQERTMRAEKINTMLDLVVRLQLFLSTKIDELAPVYAVSIILHPQSAQSRRLGGQRDSLV